MIGLHFFSPGQRHAAARGGAHRRDRRRTIRTVLDLAKPLKKTPVLVAQVCYGFIGNRMMEGYAREAERMVLEGATPAAGRRRAGRLGHGDGHSGRVRHGRHRRRRQRAQGERRQVPARSELLPGRFRAAPSAAASARRTASGYYRYEPRRSQRARRPGGDRDPRGERRARSACRSAQHTDAGDSSSAACIR